MYHRKKSLKKFATILSNHYNDRKKYDCGYRTQKFYFYFYWPKNVDENLKNEIEFIIKSNESLAENKIKKETEQVFMNTENSKTNEPHNFVLM